MTLRRKLIWVSLWYFAEGFPFGLIKDTLPVFFRVHGVRLADIGLLTLVGLPWSLKFLWAPAVDLWGHRRTWILACQALLIIGIVALLAVEPSRVTAVTWTLLVALAILSATQDIAIDAYTIELLDEEDMGPANGLRVTTYRIALISAGGALVALAGLMSWPTAFLAAAALMGGAVLFSWRMPHQQRPRRAVAMPERGVGAIRDARMAPADMVPAGVTAAFFPHGVGHLLGLQVHDVGGNMADESGRALEPPADFPKLRFLRALEPGHVVTVGPGINFIDSLLASLKSGPAAGQVNCGQDRRTAQVRRHPHRGRRARDDPRTRGPHPRRRPRPSRRSRR